MRVAIGAFLSRQWDNILETNKTLLYAYIISLWALFNYTDMVIKFFVRLLVPQAVDRLNVQFVYIYIIYVSWINHSNDDTLHRCRPPKFNRNCNIVLEKKVNLFISLRISFKNKSNIETYAIGQRKKLSGPHRMLISQNRNQM